MHTYACAKHSIYYIPDSDNETEISGIGSGSEPSLTDTDSGSDEPAMKPIPVSSPDINGRAWIVSGSLPNPVDVAESLLPHLINDDVDFKDYVFVDCKFSICMCSYWYILAMSFLSFIGFV